MKIFQKDGKFSKTAMILVLVWIVAILKWLFQGLHVSIPAAHIDWIVTFNASDAGTMVTAGSTLYFAVHNVTRLKNGNVPPAAGE